MRCSNSGRGKKFLLVKRKYEPFRSKWGVPSGLIYEYELAELAAKRVVKEDTNLDFKPIFINYYDEIFRSEGWHSVIIAFSGEIKGSINQGSSISEISWFSYDEIKRMHLASVHKEIIEDFINNEEN